MNYGYNKDTKDWNEKRKWILAEELSKTLNIPIITNNSEWKNDGHSPYIEVDDETVDVIAGWCGVSSGGTAYGGVRIRRITHLPEKEHDKLVEEADRIYGLVMNNLIRE